MLKEEKGYMAEAQIEQHELSIRSSMLISYRIMVFKSQWAARMTRQPIIFYSFLFVMSETHQLKPLCSEI